MNYTLAGGIWCRVDFLCSSVAARPRGSGRAAFLKAVDGRVSGYIHGDGVLEAVKHFVGGVLQAGVGLVQLARRLGGKLAELVAIGDVGECSKNKVRAHKVSFRFVAAKGVMVNLASTCYRPQVRFPVFKLSKLMNQNCLIQQPVCY